MKFKLVNVMAVFVFAAVALLAGCQGKDGAKPAQESKPGPPAALKMATTTSTENTGLLDHLLPAFEKKYNCKVQVLSMGTGKALKAARDGNVDVILVHDKDAELEFVAQGWGTERREIMYNDFLILGPESDPAGVRGMDSAADALAALAAAQAPFVSRGDDSGTHRKELDLWKSKSIQPSGSWYMEAGQGMEDTLRIADQKTAYVLTDRGTYLALRKKLTLTPLVEGDPELFNLYGVIPVNAAKHPGVKINTDLAVKFADWLASPEAQALIGGFKVDGEVLFHPLAADSE